MKRNTMILSSLLLTAALGMMISGRASAQEWKQNDPRVRVEPVTPVAPRLVPVPVGPRRELRVSVWTDLGDGGTVRTGEDVRVYFRTNRDAYVAVYDIDTRGRVRQLYPVNRRDDGWVAGGRTVALPGPRADYRLVASGPAGIERIVAVASDRPIRDERGFDLDLSAVIGLGGGDLDIVLAASTGGSVEVGEGARLAGGVYELEPKLIPVPRENRGSVDRDETWFRVAGRSRRGR